MLWIIGTSVSIENGGYATRVRDRAASELGIQCVNLSVGDQTSLTACLRTLGALDRIQAGDVVVWEYSLLDALLADSCVAADDIHAARRLAWRHLSEAGAHVMVLMTPPRSELRRRTATETLIGADADAFGHAQLDLRELIAELRIGDAASHYRDDRHPRLDSPLVEATVERVLAFVRERHGKPALQPAELPDAGIEQGWHWLDAETLARLNGKPIRRLQNSLLEIDALDLPVHASIGIPASTRIVALGIVSTHASGGAWCCHPGCAPASTRLPAGLDYPFLLRASGLPCIRHSVTHIGAAPDWAYQRGVWAGYGQEISSEPGPIAIFGMLHVPASDQHAGTAWQMPTPIDSLAARLGRFVRRRWRQ